MDPGYVKWILQHQDNNVRYVPLLIYARRMAADFTEAATRSSNPNETNSGELPMPDVNDGDQMVH